MTLEEHLKNVERGVEQMKKRIHESVDGKRLGPGEAVVIQIYLSDYIRVHRKAYKDDLV